MITLFRWYLMKTKEIKWKLAFWQYVDKLAKNPEELEKKLLPYIAELAHQAAQKEKAEGNQ